TLLAAIFWIRIDFEKMFQVVCAILIVACPCALALSAPFTFGHIMRILGRNKFYVKDALTIEKIAKVSTLVFDKTGTITHNKKSDIKYSGKEINESDIKNIKTLIKNSTHPLSKLLYDFIEIKDPYFEIENYLEIAGKGYSGKVRNQTYKIGSASFVGENSTNLESAVYIKKNDDYLGKFIFKNEYRSKLKEMFSSLNQFKIDILSGDNASEKSVLEKIINNAVELKFNQNPEDKLQYIQNLQNKGENVAMIGDGLNDAGALKQSNVGIAIADDSNSFTPSSDVIMDGKKITEIKDYLDLCKDAVKIVKITFVISLMYNIIGLTFAITGHLSPLKAAILMPISSISVVIFTSIATWWRSRKYFKF
ncbi:MAG: HAD-IC family P-type ATPase, partial [Chryseobacterium sp.]|nr:HAD-IC family P-type ATPase [Chryseobacterium sp.]